MFGTCPSQDEFYLVMCERCQKVIKPQAFKQHLCKSASCVCGSAKGVTESLAKNSVIMCLYKNTFCQQ